MAYKIICNKCGREFDDWDYIENFKLKKERLGYGTKYDSDRLDLDLCCSCVEQLIDDCKISPISEYKDIF